MIVQPNIPSSLNSSSNISPNLITITSPNNSSSYFNYTKNKKNTSNPQSDHNLNVATLNVHSLTSEKVEPIIDLMKTKNIHVLALQEISVRKRNALSMFKEYNGQYQVFFDNDPSSLRGCGVGFIIDRKYAQFIHKSEGFKGRILSLTLHTQHKTFNFINVYIKTKVTQEDGQLIANLYDQLFQSIQNNEENDHLTILLGDFNLSYEKYNNKLTQGKSFSSQEKIFHKLDNEFHFIDTTTLFFDDLSKIKTFEAAVGSSRIDYIWVSAVIVGLPHIAVQYDQNS